MSEAGKLDLGDGTVVKAEVSAVGEQLEFADPDNIDPSVTCGQCGAIVGPNTKDGDVCPSCQAIWPSHD